MRLVWFLPILLLMCSACLLQNRPEPSNASSSSEFWLLGDWQRTNDDEGKTTYESWRKLNDSTYTGIGCTLFEGDTVFKENLTLFKASRFEVLGVGDDGPVVFQMIESTDTSFAVVNPDNEFPKRIDYMKTASGIRAIISGEGMEIGFDFVLRD